MTENNYNGSDLRQLFDSAKKNNPAAQSRIYEMFLVPVFRYILLRTGHKQIAEDLTQNVFIKAYKSLGGFQFGNKNPLAWFFTIARNTVIDYFRKNSKITYDPDEHLYDLPASGDLFEELNRRQNLELVKNLLTKLSHEQQEVIILKYVNDLSTEEISRLLGKSQESVRQLLSRGIKRLRELVRQNNLNLS